MTTGYDFDKLENIFNDYIAGHPDAGTPPQCIMGRVEKIGILTGLECVSKLITSCFAVQGISEILISSHGYTSAARGNSFSVIGDIATCAQLEYDEQAKEVWEWLWNTAIKGNAPHIIPGMTVEPYEGDHIWYIKVTYNLDLNTSAADMWKKDCQAEKQRRTEDDRLKQETAEKEILSTKRLLDAPVFKFKLKR